jgi:hypothetical protein
MKKLLYIIAAAFTLALPSQADCVINAKSKTKFTVLDSHTILLSGGIGPDIIIKTYAFLSSSSSVTVLKDSFCSFESAVLYVDGATVDANQVTKVD